jgi:hypothetical protein
VKEEEEEERAGSSPAAPSLLALALADETSRALESSHASETPAPEEEAAPAAVALRVIAAVPQTTLASKSTSRSSDFRESFLMEQDR